MLAAFAKYAPNFKGPDTAAFSVKAIMDVVDDCSIEKGDGGQFWSHFKNKQWL
jgi:hypothetical protein